MASQAVIDTLERAFLYPYARPAHSFLFVNGACYGFKNEDWQGIENMPAMCVRQQHSKLLGAREETGAPTLSAQEAAAAHGFQGLDRLVQDVHWTPVLAIGSNASPQQLARKFSDLYPGVCIPVVECVLHGFDVVYSPGIASYGSCPATLAHSPGTLTSVYLTFLTPPLMARMHATEGAPYVYALVQLHNIELHVAASFDPTSGRLLTPALESRVMKDVIQYNYAAGALALPVQGPQGAIQSPIALAEVPAFGRRFPALTQTSLLEMLMHALDGVHLGEERDLHLPTIRKSGGLFPVQFKPPEREPVGTEDGGTEDGERQQQGIQDSSRATRLEDWVLQYIANPSLRSSYVKRLQTHAATNFTYSNYTTHNDFPSPPTAE